MLESSCYMVTLGEHQKGIEDNNYRKYRLMHVILSLNMSHVAVHALMGAAYLVLARRSVELNLTPEFSLQCPMGSGSSF